MNQQERVKKYVEWYQNQYFNDNSDKPPIPIFEIVVFEHPDKEMIYHKPEGDVASGFPDTGDLAHMGFYYELDVAIRAMNENWCDIRETVYNAGFILCHFAGLYDAALSEARIYFLWNEEKDGFFEAEEPRIFKHIAY